MSTNDLSVIPEVGSSGYFTLATPFDQDIAAGVKYTCQAVRRISDYIGNNEDVKTDIYDAKSISEAVWEEDKQADAFIVSLQGETGQWIKVPTRYVIGFPNTNGIPYRTMLLSVSLPAIPVSRDLSDVTAKIANVVKDSLGVNCRIDPMETSKVTLVDSVKHDQTQTTRNMVIGTPVTDSARAVVLQRQLDDTNVYVKQLEDFIQQNFPVSDVPTTP